MSIELKDVMAFNNLRLIYIQCNIDQSKPIRIRLKENATIEVQILEE